MAPDPLSAALPGPAGPLRENVKKRKRCCHPSILISEKKQNGDDLHICGVEKSCDLSPKLVQML